MELCPDCRNIKFGRFLRQAQKSDEDLLKKHNKLLLKEHNTHSSSSLDTSKLWENYTRLSKLGSRLRGTQLDSCAFCALLRKHRLDAGDFCNEDNLVAFRYFKVPSPWQRWDCRGTPSDLIIMAIKGSQGNPFEVFLSAFGIMQAEYVKSLLTCKLSDCKSEMLQAVPVMQPTINADELSQAIRDCHKNHQECSNRTTKMSPEPVEIYLIECIERQIVEKTSSDEEYVALSYVWGGVPAEDPSSKSLPRTLPSTLPRTLEDAIDVTKSLGFQYVWIDQFCVNQHDPVIKQKQIQTMGRVYEDAAVTLVAASGSDANHGLPGAPNRPREIRPEIKLDGVTISQKAAPISYEVERSVWATRGWTFQEQFLSRRFLIFAPEEVSFECRRVQFSENWGTRHRDEYLQTVTKPLPECSKLFSDLYRGKRWLGPENVIGSYDSLLEQYWQRRLSDGKDGINAFAAVLESLKFHWNEQLSLESNENDSIECRMTFTAGMPHLIRHHAGSPEPSLGLFLHGMSWYSGVPSERRKHFPSWCWAGWTPSESAETSKSIQAYISGCRPLAHNVFFLQNAAAGTISSGQKTIIPDRIPIADHELLSVPSAVVFDAPSIPSSVLSWSKGQSKPRLWQSIVQWSECAYTLDRGIFLDLMAHGNCCLIALSKPLKHECNSDGSYVFLLVRPVDQCRHERISLVILLNGPSISYEQIFQEQLDDVRTWELV